MVDWRCCHMQSSCSALELLIASLARFGLQQQKYMHMCIIDGLVVTSQAITGASALRLILNLQAFLPGR